MVHRFKGAQSKRPKGQNVLGTKRPKAQNVPRDKTFQGQNVPRTKRLKAQNVPRDKTSFTNYQLLKNTFCVKKLAIYVVGNGPHPCDLNL